jgi:hypothetical protein
MSKKGAQDDTGMICSCGEMHKGHICWLTHMGLLNEVRHLTDNPTVSCTKCGAKANLPHNVCFPSPDKVLD